MPDLSLARKVLQTEAAAVLALVDRLDEGFARAVMLIRNCRGRVIVTGMGKSGIICRKLAATLASTGTPAFFLHPADAVHGDLGVIQADDVVIALSYSGETEELRHVLETLKRIGAPLDRHDRQHRVDAGAGGGGGARLPRVGRGVPDEPGADGEHDRGAGDGRRAGDGGARREGLQARRLRQPASRRKARPEADAGRSVDEQGRRPAGRAAATPRCAT